MFFKSSLDRILSPLDTFSNRRSRGRKVRAKRSRRRLGHEVLENRCLLTAVTVTTSIDETDGDTTNIAALISNPGTDGAISLREAILAANSTPGANSITFDPGLAGVPMVLTQGLMSIDNELTITGLGAHNTTVDAQHSPGIFFIGTTSPVALDGLTLTNSQGDSGAVESIFFGGRLTVNDCILSNNVAGDTYGGGGGAIDSNSSVTVTNSTLSGNSAAFGGAISGHDVTVTGSKLFGNSSPPGSGGAISGSNVTVSDSNLYDNYSGGPGGGGAIDGGNVTVTGSTLSGNTALANGGAVYGRDVRLYDSKLLGNDSGVNGGPYGFGGAGGAVFSRYLTVHGSTISGNSAFGSSGGLGGGLFAIYSASIDNSIITDNNAGRSGGGLGGLPSSGLYATVSGSTISGNTAHKSGGGVFFYGPVTVENSTVSGNTAATGGGGGLDSPHSVTVTDSTISANTGVNGGGIGGRDVTVSGSTISGNTGVSGGGISSYFATVSKSSITGNSATTGGGINSQRPTVSNSTVAGNSAVTGGGIDAYDAIVTGSTISGNSAVNGGGIFGYYATLSNSTISGNSAVRGGGIASTYAVTVSNSTISGNSAAKGGGIYEGGNYAYFLTLRSSVVAGNSGNSASPDVSLSAGWSPITVTVTNSLIGDNTGSGLTPAPLGAPDANGNFVGTAASPIDPLLGPLTYNGGPMQTMALLPGSPAIDTGDNPDNLTTDERGQPLMRTAGSQTDMGAFERQTIPLTPTVSVSDVGGVFNGNPFTAVAAIAGVNGPFTPSLEGVIPTLTYYVGGTALAGAPSDAGTYQVVASFPGSAEYTAASTSATFSIAQAGTITALTSSAGATVLGQVTTFTATIGTVPPGAPTPTGTVTFWDGSTRLGDGTLNSAGQATFTTDELSLGSHAITATYNGNSNFLGGASAALTHTVLSAQQELGLMSNQVQALVTAGILSSGNGNALTVKLNNAIASLNSGNTTSGVKQMDAFINQVQAFLKARKLDSTDAQTLSSAINLAIAAALDSALN